MRAPDHLADASQLADLLDLHGVSLAIRFREELFREAEMRNLSYTCEPSTLVNRVDDTTRDSALRTLNSNAMMIEIWDNITGFHVIPVVPTMTSLGAFLGMINEFGKILQISVTLDLIGMIRRDIRVENDANSSLYAATTIPSPKTGTSSSNSCGLGSF
ncbi:hypothetical protein FNV43_RR26503 [Rhamnella rubrinervis]|uniref:Uncharacterized protein n=1 Tax=Rhamnella rubrinervis TaxID=2594499 RepID=A0A8K0DV34_9ROSA|nr:hypothetical protein FNV43_RR26503 [Rhamnella rubrinervis]